MKKMTEAFIVVVRTASDGSILAQNIFFYYTDIWNILYVDILYLYIVCTESVDILENGMLISPD